MYFRLTVTFLNMHEACKVEALPNQLAGTCLILWLFWSHWHFTCDCLMRIFPVCMMNQVNLLMYLKLKSIFVLIIKILSELFYIFIKVEQILGDCIHIVISISIYNILSFYTSVDCIVFSDSTTIIEINFNHNWW